MKKIFFILLLMMYMIGCTNNTGVQPEKKRYVGPEEIIEQYYDALKKGNKEEMNNLFITDKDLILEKALPEIEYSIREIRSITQEEAEARNEISHKEKLKNGDLEVIVVERINGHTEGLTFILRKVKKKWKIYSHSIGYYI